MEHGVFDPRHRTDHAGKGEKGVKGVKGGTIWQGSREIQQHTMHQIHYPPQPAYSPPGQWPAPYQPYPEHNQYCGMGQLYARPSPPHTMPLDRSAPSQPQHFPMNGVRSHLRGVAGRMAATTEEVAEVLGQDVLL